MRYIERLYSLFPRFLNKKDQYVTIDSQDYILCPQLWGGGRGAHFKPENFNPSILNAALKILFVKLLRAVGGVGVGGILRNLKFMVTPLVNI